LLDSKKTLYLCDTFTGVPKAGEKDQTYTGGEHADTSVDHVTALLERCGVSNFQILTGIFPDETASALPADVQFSFVHIDVDVYRSGKDVLEYVWDRMPVGGVVIFDDYGFPTANGITILVNEYRAANDRIILHNLNGHGIMVKTHSDCSLYEMT